MKKKILFAALSALLASCSNNDELFPTSSAELGIKAGIQAVNDTRAIEVGTAFGDKDQIAAYIVPLGNDDTVYRKWPTYYQYDGGTSKWNVVDGGANSGSKIYLLAEPHSLVAVYPAPRFDAGTGKYDEEFVNAPLNELNSFTDGLSSDIANVNYLHLHHSATSNTFDGSDQKDYLIGAPQQVNGSTLVVSATGNANIANVQFQHILTKVTFFINKAEDYMKPGLVTKLTISDTKSNLYSLGDQITTPTAVGKSVVRLGSATYLINSLEILNKHTESLVSFIYTTGINANAYSSSTKLPTLTGLIVPREAVENQDGSIVVSIIIDGRTYVAEIPYNTDPAKNLFKGNFVPGKNYRFTLIIHPDALQFNTVSMTDWQDVSVDQGINMN